VFGNYHSLLFYVFILFVTNTFIPHSILWWSWHLLHWPNLVVIKLTIVVCYYTILLLNMIHSLITLFIYSFLVFPNSNFLLMFGLTRGVVTIFPIFDCLRYVRLLFILTDYYTFGTADLLMRYRIRLTLLFTWWYSVLLFFVVPFWLNCWMIRCCINWALFMFLRCSYQQFSFVDIWPGITIAVYYCYCDHSFARTGVPFCSSA